VLEQAIPTLEKATLALNSIKTNDLVNLKALNTPPDLVKVVATWVMMLKPTDDVDYRNGWPEARKMMNNPSTFVNYLKEFGSKIAKVNSKFIETIKKEMKKPGQDGDSIKKVSEACYGLA